MDVVDVVEKAKETLAECKADDEEEELQKKFEVCTKLTKNSGQFGAKKDAPKKRGRKKTEGIDEMFPLDKVSFTKC